MHNNFLTAPHALHVYLTLQIEKQSRSCQFAAWLLLTAPVVRRPSNRLLRSSNWRPAWTGRVNTAIRVLHHFPIVAECLPPLNRRCMDSILCVVTGILRGKWRKNYGVSGTPIKRSPSWNVSFNVRTYIALSSRVLTVGAYKEIACIHRSVNGNSREFISCWTSTCRSNFSNPFLL